MSHGWGKSRPARQHTLGDPVAAYVAASWLREGIFSAYLAMHFHEDTSRGPLPLVTTSFLWQLSPFDPTPGVTMLESRFKAIDAAAWSLASARRARGPFEWNDQVYTSAAEAVGDFSLMINFNLYHKTSLGDLYSAFVNSHQFNNSGQSRQVLISSLAEVVAKAQAKKMPGVKVKEHFNGRSFVEWRKALIAGFENDAAVMSAINALHRSEVSHVYRQALGPFQELATAAKRRSHFAAEMELEFAAACADNAALQPRKRRDEQEEVERLQFDDTALVVKIDGVSHKVEDPRSYRIYKAIAMAPLPPVTKDDIRQMLRPSSSADDGGPRGLRGVKAIPNLLDSLPEAVRETINISPSGYWVSVGGEKEVETWTR